MSDQKHDSPVFQAMVTSLLILCLGLGLLAYHEWQINRSIGKIKDTNPSQSDQSTNTPTANTTPAAATSPSAATTVTSVTCQDVTSYDYNWNNDVLCTNPDGSTFYTNYAGGNKYGYHFSN